MSEDIEAALSKRPGNCIPILMLPFFVALTGKLPFWSVMYGFWKGILSHQRWNIYWHFPLFYGWNRSIPLFDFYPFFLVSKSNPHNLIPHHLIYYPSFSTLEYISLPARSSCGGVNACFLSELLPNYLYSIYCPISSQAVFTRNKYSWRCFGCAECVCFASFPCFGNSWGNHSKLCWFTFRNFR